MNTTVLPGKLPLGAVMDDLIDLAFPTSRPALWQVEQVNLPYLLFGVLPQPPPHFVEPTEELLCMMGITAPAEENMPPKNVSAADTASMRANDLRADCAPHLIDRILFTVITPMATSSLYVFGYIFISVSINLHPTWTGDSYNSRRIPV